MRSVPAVQHVRTEPPSSSLHSVSASTFLFFIFYNFGPSSCVGGPSLGSWRARCRQGRPCRRPPGATSAEKPADRGDGGAAVGSSHRCHYGPRNKSRHGGSGGVFARLCFVGQPQEGRRGSSVRNSPKHSAPCWLIVDAPTTPPLATPPFPAPFVLAATSQLPQSLI